MSDDLFHGVLLDVNRLVLRSGIPGTFAEFDGWLVVDSGTRIDALNHALVSDADRAVRSFDSVKRWFGERGAGFQLYLRIPGDGAVFELATEDGYIETRSQPLMVAALPLADYAVPAGVNVITVGVTEDIRKFLSVRGPGAGRPPNEDEEVAITKFLATGRLRYFVATENGVPIATSSVAVSGTVVSISNVWVVEAARKRGIGAAMTAMAAATEPHAEWAILEASAMGEPVYRRMSFSERFRYVRLAQQQGRGGA